MTADTKAVTAVDLVHAYLELLQFNADIRDGTLDRMGGNPPREIRLRRLQAWRRGREAAPEFQRFFYFLLGYRQTAEEAFEYEKRFLECGGLPAYAFMHVIHDANQAIRQRLLVIDDLLAGLIDPGRRTFTVAQLAQDFGYPDVDLAQIDADWF